VRLRGVIALLSSAFALPCRMTGAGVSRPPHRIGLSEVLSEEKSLPVAEMTPSDQANRTSTDLGFSSARTLDRSAARSEDGASLATSPSGKTGGALEVVPTRFAPLHFVALIGAHHPIRRRLSLAQPAATLFRNRPCILSSDRRASRCDEGSARRLTASRCRPWGRGGPIMRRLRSATTTGRQRRGRGRQPSSGTQRSRPPTAGRAPRPCGTARGPRAASRPRRKRPARTVGVRVLHAGVDDGFFPSGRPARM